MRERQRKAAFLRFIKGKQTAYHVMINTDDVRSSEDSKLQFPFRRLQRGLCTTTMHYWFEISSPGCTVFNSSLELLE